VFPFAFQDIANGDPKCDSSNPSGQDIEACEKRDISKHKHDPTVDSEDMTTKAYNLFWVGSSKFYASHSLAEFSVLSHFFLD
jgi:hypothetical protein